MAQKEDSNAVNNIEQLEINSEEMQKLISGAKTMTVSDLVEIDEDDDESEIVTQYKNMEIRANIHRLKRDGKILEAMHLLEKLLPRQTDPIERFSTMIELNELYCKYDKVVEAYTSIDRLRKLVDTMKLPQDVLKKSVETFFTSEKYVRAFLYWICQSCDVTTTDLTVIPEWVYTMIKIVAKLSVNYNLLCTQLVLPLIMDIYNYHSVLKKSHAEFVVNKAWILYGVSVCRGYLRDFDEMKNDSRSVCQLMEKYIGKEAAPLYRVYGLAAANTNDPKKAVTAFTMANDWPSNEIKEKCIQSVKKLP